MKRGEKVPQVDLESRDSRATPLACLGAKSFQSHAAQLFRGSIRRCLQKISGISSLTDNTVLASFALCLGLALTSDASVSLPSLVYKAACTKSS